MTAADILSALGISSPNAALLAIAEEEAKAEIMRRCRLTSLPDDMAYVVARFTAGRYLAMAVQSGSLTELNGADLGSISSIREGDTQISYNTGDSGASRINALVSDLTDGVQLTRWRRLDWKPEPEETDD